MSGLFNDVATKAIYQAMQGLSAQQQAIANNVANVNTPNYKAEDVNFESSLAQAIANGDPAQAQIQTTYSADPAQQNGNNVSLATEMVDGEKSSMQFQTMVSAMNAQFQLLSTAISGNANGN